MVWDIRPISLCGQLLGLQETCDRGSSENKQNPKTSTRASLVHETRVLNSDRWNPSFWGCFHRAVLHFDIHMAKPVLLHIRVSFHRVCDLDHHVCRDNSRALLLPVMQRRLPLVVAGLFDSWLLRIVSFSILDFLLFHQTGNHKAGLGYSLLWVHVNCFLCFLRFDGYNRVLCLFMVCSQDIFICENRLKTYNSVWHEVEGNRVEVVSSVKFVITYQETPTFFFLEKFRALKTTLYDWLVPRICFFFCFFS
ncbi:hypothetical protein R6Q59_013010 [Mikania micrantha]